MVAQSIASRPRRPKHTEPDDVVLARALEAVEWTKRNRTLVTVIVVVLVVVIGGFLWYRSNEANRMENAAIDFLQVEQVVMSGEETSSLQQLQSYIQRHGDTPYGDEARVLMGQVHLRAGRAQEAIDAVEPVASEIRSSPVGPQAALLLAAAQQAAGQNDAAVQTYLNIGDQADTPFRREEGLASAALLLAENGDLQRAADLYRQLVDLNEGTPEAPVYEMRLAEVEAQLSAQ